jgi:hypothetical protein
MASIDHNCREQVIARLVARHGLDHENAAAAWEEYLLDLLAKRMCREVACLHIENN